MTRMQSLSVIVLIGVCALAAGRLWPDAPAVNPSPVALAQPGDTSISGGGGVDAAAPSVVGQAQPAPWTPSDDWAGPPMGPALGGEFEATGLCAPALVTPEMLAWAFTPIQGENKMAVDQTETTIAFGDYTVNVDAASRSVTVTGPEGADVLSRDIDRCVVGEGEPGVPPATIGNWRYADGTGWRYVDEPNPAYSETADQ